ncbi:MAG: SPW repeat domain-containing protein [Gemmatimonadota bacterium]
MEWRFRWLELGASVWLMTAPFVFGHTGPAFGNEVIVGLLAAVVTLVRWYRDRVWWALLPFGAWLLIAAPLLGYTDVGAAVWTDLSAGVVFLAGAAVRRGRRHRRDGEPM